MVGEGNGYHKKTATRAAKAKTFNLQHKLDYLDDNTNSEQSQHL